MASGTERPSGTVTTDGIPVALLFADDGKASSPAHNEALARCAIAPSAAGSGNLAYELDPLDMADREHARVDILQRLGVAALAVDWGPGLAPASVLEQRSSSLLAVIDAVQRSASGDKTPALELFVDAGAMASLVARQLADAPSGRDDLPIHIVADPLARLAKDGGLDIGLDHALHHLAQATARARDGGRPTWTIGVSIRPYHEAGATPADGLALALATACPYLRACDAAGVDARDAAARFVFHLPVRSDLFGAIAELRAARVVWERLLQACGVPPWTVPMRLHASCASRDLSSIDPWNNVVRTSVMSFAAIVGGADLVFARAMTWGDVTAGAFERRLAINSQLVLRRESHLGEVLDPVGGSGYVEALTDAVSRTAWERFGEIEASGGIVEVLRNGSLRARLRGRAAEAQHQLAVGRKIMVGVNRFCRAQWPLAPELERDVPQVAKHPTPPSPRHGAGGGAAGEGFAVAIERARSEWFTRHGETRFEVAPLSSVRPAAAIEALFERTHRLADRRDGRPRVFVFVPSPATAHRECSQSVAQIYVSVGFDIEVHGLGAKGRDPNVSPAPVHAALRVAVWSLDLGLDPDFVTRLRAQGFGHVALWSADGTPCDPPEQLSYTGATIGPDTDIVEHMDRVLSCLEARA